MKQHKSRVIHRCKACILRTNKNDNIVWKPTVNFGPLTPSGLIRLFLHMCSEWYFLHRDYSYFLPFGVYLSIKARNLCVCVCVCVCGRVPQISADKHQTDLRFSTWLLHGSRVCNVRLVWTTMILSINDFINSLQIPVALSTIAMCAPEPITAELTPLTCLEKQAHLYLQRCKLDRDYAGGLVPFFASKLTVD